MGFVTMDGHTELHSVTGRSIRLCEDYYLKPIRRAADERREAQLDIELQAPHLDPEEVPLQ